MNISDWIPRRKPEPSSSPRKAWESPNQTIWISIHGHGLRFHLCIGPVSLMIAGKVKK